MATDPEATAQAIVDGCWGAGDEGGMHFYEADLAEKIVAAINAERDACWNEINAHIKQGELPEPAHSERNGLVLACNLILRPNRPSRDVP